MVRRSGVEALHTVPLGCALPDEPALFRQARTQTADHSAMLSSSLTPVLSSIEHVHMFYRAYVSVHQLLPTGEQVSFYAIEKPFLRLWEHGARLKPSRTQPVCDGMRYPTTDNARSVHFCSDFTQHNLLDSHLALGPNSIKTKGHCANHPGEGVGIVALA